MQLSKKQKAFSEFFITFLQSALNFKHFEKNMSLLAQVFLKLWLLKTCLLKCIKGLVSENPLAVNVLTSPKNCWKLQKSTSTKLSHHFERVWVRKGHFQLHPRFKDCLLTRWLPTAGILVVIGIVTATNSNAFIWKTETLFSVCYCIFGMYIKFWTFWKKIWGS